MYFSKTCSWRYLPTSKGAEGEGEGEGEAVAEAEAEAEAEPEPETAPTDDTIHGALNDKNQGIIIEHTTANEWKNPKVFNNNTNIKLYKNTDKAYIDSMSFPNDMNKSENESPQGKHNRHFVIKTINENPKVIMMLEVDAGN